MKNFLKGHFVWLFGAIFFAVILLFLTKDSNPQFAAWTTFIVGSCSACGLQYWYHKKYETARFDLLNVGVAIFIFVVFSTIRSFME